MKKIMAAALLLVSLLVLTCTAQAADSAVTITSDLSETNYRTTIEGTVSVRFDDSSLYNEGVLLSWHLYDAAGQELQFENQRLALTVENGEAQVPVTIDLSGVDACAGQDTVEIRFDLVDQTNVFWFSTNPVIRMDGLSVTYRHSLWGEFLESMKNVVTRQPALLALNLLADAVLIVLVLRWRRKKKTPADGTPSSRSQERPVMRISIPRAENPPSEQENASQTCSPSEKTLLREPFWKRRDGLCVFFLYCLILLGLYLRYLLAGQIPMSGDAILTFAEPYLSVISAGTGQLAMWNKYLAAGVPLISTYTPLMLLSFLPFRVLAYVLYIGFVAVGGSFAYRYFKKIGCTPLAAFCVSLCYLLSIQLGGARKSHCTLIYTMALLPVILYLVEMYFDTRKLRWLLGSAAVMALQFIVGFSQQCIYAALFVGIYLIAFGLHKRMKLGQMLRHGLLWAGAYLSLIAWKLLAITQESSFYASIGAEDTSFSTFTSYSIHPVKLLEMLFPKFLGGDVYMAFGVTNSSEMDVELFLGWLPAILILFALVVLLKNFRVRFAFAAMVVTFAYAAQAHIPYLANVIYRIPVLSGFRVPSRILFLFLFCAYTLCALALSALQEKALWGKFTRVFAVGTGVCLGGAAVILVLLRVVYRVEWMSSLWQYVRTNLLTDFLLIALCALAAILLYRFQAQLGRRAYPMLCLCVVVLTLVQTLPYTSVTAPSDPSEIQVTDDLSLRLKEELGDGKVWDAFQGIDGAHESLISLNRSITKEIPSINSYIAMNDPRLYRMMSGAAAGPLNYSGLMTGSLNADQNLHLQNALLSMLGITYIIDSSGLVSADTGILTVDLSSGQTVAQAPEIQLSADGAPYAVYSSAFPIEPYTCYQISFDCVSDMEQSFYVDFYGGAGYDSEGQQAAFTADTAPTHCSAVVYSGDTAQADGELCWRIIAMGEGNLTIKDFTISVLTSQREENVYQLWDEGDGTPIYLNTHARDILYVPDEIAALADAEALITNNLAYQVDRVNYTNDLSPVTLDTAGTSISNIDFSYNDITATVDTAADTFVNFSQCSYPGWKAYVDGEETELYTVNGLIMGMEVPAGTHTIRFAYVSWLLIAGLGYSTCAVVVLAAALVVTLRRDKKPRQAGASSQNFTETEEESVS